MCCNLGRLVRWHCSSFNFTKRWHFVCRFTVCFLSVVSSFTLAPNVLQLGDVADLEALTFNLALMFIRNPNVQFSTEPAILPNCC
jgi:hypothetical protein